MTIAVAGTDVHDIVAGVFRHRGCDVVVLRGALDSYSHRDLGEVLTPSGPRGAGTGARIPLVVDLSQVQFVTLDALCSLADAVRSLGVRLVGPLRPEVLRVLRRTGLDALLHVQPSVDLACDRAAAHSVTTG